VQVPHVSWFETAQFVLVLKTFYLMQEERDGIMKSNDWGRHEHNNNRKMHYINKSELSARDLLLYAGSSVAIIVSQALIDPQVNIQRVFTGLVQTSWHDCKSR
jgi:hypothetical protein